MKYHLVSKTFLVLIIYTIFLSTVIAQIPNSGFEDWTWSHWNSPTDSIYYPNKWTTNSSLPYAYTVDRVRDAHSGSYALRGDVRWTKTFLWSPDVYNEFPLSYKPASFVGYYQFLPLGGDTLFINIQIYHQKVPIAVATLTVDDTVSSYTQFQIPLNYVTNDIPDANYINFHIHNAKSIYLGVGTSGSYFLLDDLAFSGISPVSENRNKAPHFSKLLQNYPNPFNPTTRISFAVQTTEFVTLKIYDNLGREVTTLVEEQLPAGDYSVRWDTDAVSGIYYYCIRAGTFIQTR